MNRREPGGSGLYGRRDECDRLDHLLTEVRAGRSQVLVLRGDAGIGKTALLDHLAERAAGCRVARAVGVESETELAFAGLHQLCAPFLDRLDRLPPPQRDALGTVFGLREGTAPDRFFTGLAALGLLSAAADERPLVCLVDDAQWLDRESAQVLAFAARRLLAEQVALVFATREVGDDPTLHGLAELRVPGLGDGDARALLDAAQRVPLDGATRAEIVAEARGNPLALLELPRARTSTEVAFGFAQPRAATLVSRLEREFLRRLHPLPPPTRRLLLVAAVEPSGEAGLVHSAAARLGIGAGAAAPAVAAGLIDVGSRFRFRHPLLRSALLHAADAGELREVHAVLAAATGLDPDRRAWHRAQASAGPDEEIAAELEASAGRARGRGGLTAAAAFLERAVALTSDPARQAARALTAAQAKLRAGAFAAASDLIDVAGSGPPDDARQARIELLRAQAAFAAERSQDAPRLLLSAAARLEPVDDELARETYLDAFSAATFTGRLDGDAGLRRVAQAVRRVPMTPRSGRDLVLHSLAVLFTDGYEAALPVRRRLVRAFRSAEVADAGEPRLLWLASLAAAESWDEDGWNALSARHVQIARDSGALGELPLALNSRIVALLLGGELPAAAGLIEEVRAVADATGTAIAPYGALVHAALRGREAPARELIDTTVAEVADRGEGIGGLVAHWSAALLHNGLGRPEDALAPARRAGAFPVEIGVANWGALELLEAAVRCGDTRTARSTLDRIASITGPARTEWALGVEARSRALLAVGDAADELYGRAVHHLGRTRIRVELARTHLLYGEWLSRRGRHGAAREHLRAAHQRFTAMGAEAFGARARRELTAAGEAVADPEPVAREELTAQETEIARLAALGRTNPEIGAQLFLSPRTVEWHLRKVFAKLGVGSRRDLRATLPVDVRTSVSG